jgi:hypothetical protein
MELLFFALDNLWITVPYLDHEIPWTWFHGTFRRSSGVRVSNTPKRYKIGLQRFSFGVGGNYDAVRVDLGFDKLLQFPLPE